MNITEIQNLQNDTSARFEESLQRVCSMAQKDPDGLTAVAELLGYKRELEVLHKVQASLLSHGRPDAMV